MLLTTLLVKGLQQWHSPLFIIMFSQMPFLTQRFLYVLLSLCSHEYISGYYRVSVYFLCKILSDIITLRTMPAIIFTCVAYFMVGRWKTSCAILVFTL